MPSLFSTLRGTPHILKNILSFLDVPDRLSLAFALQDVLEMIQDNRLSLLLSYEVSLLRRGFAHPQGYWVPSQSCHGSLVAVDSGAKFKKMLELLRSEMTDDPWTEANLRVCLVLAKSRDEAIAVSSFLNDNHLMNIVAEGPLSPASTIQIRQHEGIYLGNQLQATVI
jgi:hypothetical protein